MLSVLLPELEARGERPSILVGTSVGAINAAALASTAHLPAERAIERELERWRQIDRAAVIRPVIQRLPLTALRFAGGMLGIPGVRLQSLLDPSPLEQQPQELDQLAQAPSQPDQRRGPLARRGRDGGRQRAAGRVRRGRAGQRGAQLAGDRLRGRQDRADARARLGRDPDPVPAREGDHARGGRGLVRGRRHPPEHADQARDRPRGRARGRDRHRLGDAGPQARGPPRRTGARLRRQRPAPARGGPRRPARGGPAQTRRHQHLLRQRLELPGRGASPRVPRAPRVPPDPVHLRRARRTRGRSPSSRWTASTPATAG